MNLLRAFVDRWHKLIREFAKFGIIGVVNTVVDIGILNLLTFPLFGHGAPMQGSELKAKVIATAVSATTSYFMNRHWTFRHRDRSGLRREYTLFVIFNAIGLAIQLACIGLVTDGFGQTGWLWVNVATVIGTGIGMVFRFWAYQTWVFRHPEDAIYEPAQPIEEIVAEAHHEHIEPASLGDPR